MNRNRWAAIVAALAVVAVLVLGFSFLGSPARQRLVRADMQAVQALAGLAQQINYAWNRAGKTLPANLDKLPGTKKDAMTGQPFIYHPKQDGAYELCATFATDSRERPDANTADGWLHPKGDYCFQLDASEPVPSAPYSYPY